MPDRAVKLHVPDAVRDIARHLEEAGYETWAVGGAVRDALLGDRRSDWDLATAARPETVRELFRASYPIGIQFGTVGVRGPDGKIYEVTTFRRDLETDGRHAVVEYADELDEDLARRDFTINAIAYHPLRHRLHDPYGGREDLRSRRLQSVGAPAERFAEDYLRILRGLRFAGRYDLEIEETTWTALRQAVVHLPRLSGERVREELLKVLEGPGAPRGLRLYRQSGALAALLPELSGLDDSAWEGLVRGIERLPRHRPLLRLALLLQPAGSALPGVAERLRLSNAETRECEGVHRGLTLALPEAEDTAGARRWVHRVGRSRARDVLRIQLARTAGGGISGVERADLAARARAVLGVLRRRDPVEIGDLAIDGNDLKAIGLEPGPKFARILEDCLERVIEDPERNTRRGLLDYARGRYASGPEAGED